MASDARTQSLPRDSRGRPGRIVTPETHRGTLPQAPARARVEITLVTPFTPWRWFAFQVWISSPCQSEGDAPVTQPRGHPPSGGLCIALHCLPGVDPALWRGSQRSRTPYHPAPTAFGGSAKPPTALGRRPALLQQTASSTRVTARGRQAAQSLRHERDVGVCHRTRGSPQRSTPPHGLTRVTGDALASGAFCLRGRHSCC
jgi:hypothetical protein